MVSGCGLFKSTGWGYNIDADARQQRATGEKEEGKGGEALRVSDVLTCVHLYVTYKNLHACYEAVTFDP